MDSILSVSFQWQKLQGAGSAIELTYFYLYNVPLATNTEILVEETNLACD